MSFIRRIVYKIIDFVFLGDIRMEESEKEKIEKYQDLARELLKI